jgi:4'-phosphopantetheinyl transferase EntD
MSAPAGLALFPLAFSIETPFGVCMGVDLAAALAADPAVLIAALHPEERPLSRGMRGARLAEFAGGRIASRLARAGMPGGDGPTLRSPDGAPQVGPISVSISHTARIAVALAGTKADRHVGVDIETLDDAPGLDLLAERILAEDEAEAADAMPILARLSLKEAAWKACFPLAGRVPLRRIVIGGGAAPTAKVEAIDVAVATYRVGDDVVSAAAARRPAISQPAASPIGSHMVNHTQSIGVRIRS